MLDADSMGETPHLLLVDDERSIREPLAQYLTKQGFRVTQTGDAEAARTRLAAYAIDLVILDIMMPGEDGLSLCRHIRETSETPSSCSPRAARRPTGSSGSKWAPTIMS